MFVCEIIIPYEFSNFIDIISKSECLADLNKTLCIIVIASLILLLTSFFKGILSSQLNEKVTNRFINQVDRKLEKIPLSKSKCNDPAYLNTRIFNDVITSVTFSIDTLIPSLIMFVSTCFLFYMVASINIIMLTLMSISLLINVLGIVILNKYLYTKGYAYREANNNYFAANHDRLASIKETKIHSWYDISGVELEKTYNIALRKKLSLVKIMSLQDVIGLLSKNITIIMIMIVGSRMFLKEDISIGQLILISSYTSMCLGYSEHFLKLGQSYQHAKVCYSRLEEFFIERDEINGSNLVESIHRIEIKEMSFSYPDSESLYSNFNLKLDKGKIYCLKGKNGLGKSTLVDILLGINYGYTGSIEYNGINIKTIDMIQTRRENISVILQEPKIHSKSLMENITRGVSLYFGEALKGLVSTFAINKIKNEDARTMSGGEKQKLAIIRGLLKAKDFLVLDEPVSALDSSSISSFKKELLKIKDHKIILIISHNEELYEIVDDFIELA